MEEVKYTKLNELLNAVANQEIVLSDDDAITIDNDVAYLYMGEDKVFECAPNELLRDALDVLKLPWEEA